MRRDVVQEIERTAQGIPVKHVTVERDPDENTNVLVVANQTVLSDELLDRIRKRAAQGKAALPDRGAAGRRRRARRRRPPTAPRAHRAAQRRDQRHGQIVHPDPYTAAMNVVHDERVDEIIVSTFPGEKSGWLRRDLVERLRKDTGLPVDHVISPVRQAVHA